MKYINKLILLLLVSLSIMQSTNAEPLIVDVVPINNQVQPGETATYKVNLTNGGTANETLINLYVSKEPADFSYVFSATTGVIPPHETKQVDLSVTIPVNKPVGIYSFDVSAIWQIESGKGAITITKTSNYLNVIPVIPEFPTIALPLISELGIMLLMSRRKGRGS